jgi:phosphoglycolate phosphatase-like HAD superfamily hydrolase
MTNYLSYARVVFWDFDGVVKDSVDVKTRAYFQLFEPFGRKLAERVREHHEQNGGMSRYDKFPLYLQWCDVKPTQAKVNEYCERFSQEVLQGVISSPWVAGVESYLRSNPRQQTFFMVSATPQDELEFILRALNLYFCFVKVYGAPIRKQDAIHKILGERDLDAHDCLMIGDAKVDFDAAMVNQVPFLLRRHSSNTKAFADYRGAFVLDFTKL